MSLQDKPLEVGDRIVIKGFPGLDGVAASIEEVRPKGSMFLYRVRPDSAPRAIRSAMMQNGLVLLNVSEVQRP